VTRVQLKNDVSALRSSEEALQDCSASSVGASTLHLVAGINAALSCWCPPSAVARVQLENDVSALRSSEEAHVEGANRMHGRSPLFFFLSNRCAWIVSFHLDHAKLNSRQTHPWCMPTLPKSHSVFQSCIRSRSQSCVWALTTCDL